MFRLFWSSVLSNGPADAQPTSPEGRYAGKPAPRP